MGDWEAEEGVDVFPEVPGEDYCSSWSQGAVGGGPAEDKITGDSFKPQCRIL